MPYRLVRNNIFRDLPTVQLTGGSDMKATRREVLANAPSGTSSSKQSPASSATRRQPRGQKNHHYIIRGGLAGRERLRVLARIMRRTTLDLFARAGIKPGMTCLDVGCGGGDVTFEFADLVGPGGKVVGWDIDETKIELARREAAERRQGNVEFRLVDVAASEGAPVFDIVYARFLLTHLPDPVGALAKMLRVLQPGGIVMFEDIDCTGCFCHPDSAAFWRYMELYTQTARRRGGDPDIGPRLPAMLLDAGVDSVRMNVVQPSPLDGDVKLATPLTMENIVDSVLAEGLASKAELNGLIEDLYQFARNPRTVASTPRIVQAWGYRPAG
jgi:2-polyprenyl-3-methyl-5-hydroxy-6-metoxy-1,4-benzoquinol methylase